MFMAKVISDLKDPRGWTVENNPHKWKYPVDERNRDKFGYVWQDFMEFEEDGVHIKACHACIKRAKYGSGNCVDHGEYFICLPKEVRDGKRQMPKRTIQSKLM